VQGLDYAYTLQGWLKGVNSTAVGDGSFDMGGDGKIGGSNVLVARDAYGFSLNYFTATQSGITVNDYKSINSSVTPFVNNVFNLTNTDAATVAKPLFNGNIAAMAVNISKLGAANVYGYAYDQLNRIRSMDAFSGINNSNNTFTASPSANYKERISYDANGNIKTYLRNGDAARQYMDDMVYSYKAGKNQLDRVVDAAPDAVGNYHLYNDLKRTQPNGSQGQAAGNYSYDAIGNLTADISEGITNISWSVYGKILSITKASGTITYTYDAGGNRISKTANNKTTWYVRDASGNVMAVYEKEASANLKQTEVHLYGSSRLGIWNRNLDMINPPTGNITTFERGKKFFELSNHLGNVLVTVSDRKIGVSGNGTTIDYYMADVVSATDNYVFGMTMPGRNYQSDNYRYGFNGKEKDAETLTQDYGFRIYDYRIAKFLSVDPLTKEYPELTPYQFASNTPIKAVDLDGLETSWRPQGQTKPNENDYGSRSESSAQYSHVNRELYVPKNDEKPQATIKACDHCPKRIPTADNDKPNLRTPESDPIVQQIRKDNIEKVENSPTNFFPVISNIKKFGKYELMGMHKEAASSLKDAAVEAVVSYGVGKIIGAGYGYLRNLSAAAKGVSEAPGFIVSKGGTAFPVPKGATGPFPATSGKGFQFIEGVGGNGLSPKVTGFRFMDPVTTGKFQYPGGYGSYFNKAGQTINPFTGQTISPSNPWWHIPAK
jgi:RHS repeat-associated protein